MRPQINFLLIGTAVALAGCATTSAPSLPHEPYVRPGLIMLTADQAAQRGINVGPPRPQSPGKDQPIEPLDASAVEASAGIKVYTLNRTVDPFDQELLHEEHVVYRRESSPRWRLDVPADQKILVGPRVTDGREDLKPLLDKELTGFLTDQRRATEANQKAITALFQAVEALNRQNEMLAKREIEHGVSEKQASVEDDARATDTGISEKK